MDGLGNLGLVVLAILSISAGSIGYLAVRGLIERQGVFNAVERIAQACREVSAFGGERLVEIEVPAGRTIHFSDNRIRAGEIAYPEEGLPYRFRENLPPIEAGRHRVRVSISDGRLSVWTS